MKPKGPLMIEHRLIEKAIDILKKMKIKILQENKINNLNIHTIIDFIRIYADQTHHGKEEDILFEQLKNKNLDKEDKKMMDDLINEHNYARSLVKELNDANEKFQLGDKSYLNIIIKNIDELINFYPGHIIKEDEIFFPDSEKYFDVSELNEMLASFYEFDKKMIHRKYKSVVESLQQLYI